MDLFKILYIALVCIFFTGLSPVYSLDWWSWLFGSRETTESQFYMNKDGEHNGTPNKNEKRFLTADAEPTWSEWSDVVTSCSVTCGRGIGTRTRTCSSGSRSDCSGMDYKLDVCELPECHTARISSTSNPASPSGHTGAWSEWSDVVTSCSATCGRGIGARNRTCSSWIRSDCSGMDYKLDVCELPECHTSRISSTSNPASPSGHTGGISSTSNPASPSGHTGAWSEWSDVVTSCSVTCGRGIGSRTRTCSSGSRSDCSGMYYKLDVCELPECHTARNFEILQKQEEIKKKRFLVTNTIAAPTTSKFTCATCGDNNPDLCEFLFEENTVCPEPYCVIILRNSDSGQRLVERKCGSLRECKTDWWQHTSRLDKCMLFDPNFIYTQTFECTYCCTTANCNLNLHPENYTLYREN